MPLPATCPLPDAAGGGPRRGRGGGVPRVVVGLLLLLPVEVALLVARLPLLGNVAQQGCSSAAPD